MTNALANGIGQCVHTEEFLRYGPLSQEGAFHMTKNLGCISSLEIVAKGM